MHLLSLFALLLICLYNLNALDNGLALTPPMGWLSWQRFRCLTDCNKFPTECLSEELIKRTADKMVLDGYLAAGYEYIIIDDCWSNKSRDADNRLQADSERFPSGIKALADYVHKLGLKFGIYGDYGTYTCGGYPGSKDYLELDAQTWAEWGVDYLKLDGCYIDLPEMEEGYVRMSQYLNATGRPIVFSCSFPAYEGLKANYSLAVENCNLWRNYGDIDDSWESVSDITSWFTDNQDFLKPYAAPGHWNDPDMLIIGNFGLSLEQSKSQMTIWTLLSAPLIMSVDLDEIKERFRDILVNPTAIRINQDPLGIQGTLVNKTNDILIFQKPLSSGIENLEEVAIGVVSNRTDGYYYPVDIDLSQFLTSDYKQAVAIDVWADIGEIKERTYLKSDIMTVRVPPTGAVLLLIRALHEK